MTKRPTRLDYCQYLLVSPINHTLTNFAGAAGNFDGNGPFLRAQVGGGPILVGEANPEGNLESDKISCT